MTPGLSYSQFDLGQATVSILTSFWINQGLFSSNSSVEIRTGLRPTSMDREIRSRTGSNSKSFRIVSLASEPFLQQAASDVLTFLWFVYRILVVEDAILRSQASSDSYHATAHWKELESEVIVAWSSNLSPMVHW